MTRSSVRPNETDPLLSTSRPPSPKSVTRISTTEDPESSADEIHPTRAIEDDVLPETTPLGRTLSRQSAFIIVISRVIGSGIFATPGTIARATGSPGLALTLWIVGAAVAACGLSVSLEFGSMLPRSGGDKVYLEFVYRRPRFLASVLVAIHAVLLGFTASNCVVFSEYVLFAIDRDGQFGDVVRKGVALGLLTVITVMHGVFPRAGVRIQNVLGWVKVGIVIFMIVSGVYVVVFRGNTRTDETMAHAGSGVHPSGSELSWDRLWEGSVWNWGIVATSLFKVFYSYAGLDNVNNVLNEVKDPVRTLRAVTSSALVTACGLYLLVNVAYFMVVPMEEIKSSGEMIAALFFERIFGRSVGGKILPGAIALSAAGNVMVVAFSMARLKQEIARQGFLPYSELISSTLPFHSPLGALIVHYIPSALVILLPPSREVYSFILEVEGYPAQFFALAVSFGLIWLRFKRPDLKRPFKAWIPGVVLRMMLSLALISAPFFPPEKNEGGLFYATYAIVGVSIIIIGVLYWFVWTKLIPWWGGYKLDEETAILKDGTTITKLVRISK